MTPSETRGYASESDWLKHILQCLSDLNKESDKKYDCSWAAYHATKNATDSEKIHSSVCALLRLFVEASTSVSMLRHGMDLISNLTQFLNPLQTPVMYEDQPLYTIGKLIQWNWPELYGENKFVMMFAPFHIEKAFLGIIGQYMAGCGWISVVVNAGMTARGTAEALLKVTQVKKSRTAHEITAAALYKLLNEAHHADSTDISLESWADEKTAELPTFKFWLTSLKLEVLLLFFVRSIREGNYNSFKECLKEMMPWFFIFHHPNYARWLSVHIADLEALPVNAPDVHGEFSKGNFVIRKTQKPFSALAVDQAHEQHNAIVKGDGDAIGLTQDPTALRRWMIAGPEICRFFARIFPC
ncbi:hypothetical protein O0L34_g19419 [Tuta absoluta]|nr:hypothetical protein O0L34_g19419 [Tuta absoluta]